MIGFLQLLAMVVFFISTIMALALKKSMPGNKIAEMYAVGLIFVTFGVGIACWRKWNPKIWFFVALVLACGVSVGLLFCLSN